jgi:hypothetical protein
MQPGENGPCGHCFWRVFPNSVLDFHRYALLSVRPLNCSRARGPRFTLYSLISRRCLCVASPSACMIRRFVPGLCQAANSRPICCCGGKKGAYSFCTGAFVHQDAYRDSRMLV